MAEQTRPHDPAPFGERLLAAVARTGPVCAGIDPSAGLLADWGLPDGVAGLRRFAAHLRGGLRR